MTNDRVTIKDVKEFLEGAFAVDLDELNELLDRVKEMPDPVEISREQAIYLENTGVFWNTEDEIIWKTYRDNFVLDDHGIYKEDIPFNLDGPDGDLFRKAVNFGYTVKEDKPKYYIFDVGNGMVMWDSLGDIEFHERDFYRLPARGFKYVFTAEELEGFGVSLEVATEVNKDGSPV